MRMTRVLVLLSHQDIQAHTCVLTYLLIRYRDEDGSDTESTSEESNVGGDGKYSHGDLCLTHQHWVQQLIASGAFAVHDTEGPEAAHKVCMNLASTRVRHLDVVTTKTSMREYLCRDLLFRNLKVLLTRVLARLRHTYLRTYNTLTCAPDTYVLARIQHAYARRRDSCKRLFRNASTSPTGFEKFFRSR